MSSCGISKTETVKSEKWEGEMHISVTSTFGLEFGVWKGGHWEGQNHGFLVDGGMVFSYSNVPWDVTNGNQAYLIWSASATVCGRD